MQRWGFDLSRIVVKISPKNRLSFRTDTRRPSEKILPPQNHYALHVKLITNTICLSFSFFIFLIRRKEQKIESGFVTNLRLLLAICIYTEPQGRGCRLEGHILKKKENSKQRSKRGKLKKQANKITKNWFEIWDGSLFFFIYFLLFFLMIGGVAHICSTCYGTIKDILLTIVLWEKIKNYCLKIKIDFD